MTLEHFLEEGLFLMGLFKERMFTIRTHQNVFELTLLEKFNSLLSKIVKEER